MQFWDISPILSHRTAVFPGDHAFRRDVTLAFEKGHHLTLSSISSTLHVGAHADAPSHYHGSGKSIEQVGLEPYIGPVQVMTARAQRGARVYPQDLVWPTELPPRVLIRTNSFPDPDRWNSDFCSLSPELIVELHQRGVVLVGIDTPSVDPETSKELESHQALFNADMRVLEGLAMNDVPDGLYFLVALPLRIEAADASPVRAVLFPMSFFHAQICHFQVPTK